jgi:hypothetical protein
MARFDVLTESGSRYIIDTDLKLMRRERAISAPDDPAVMVSKLMNDYEDVPYHDLHAPLVVGSYVYTTWFNGRRPVIRHSTRIVAVEEIDVPPAQDQPA